MLLTLTESAKLHFINLIKSQPKKLTAKDQQLNLRIQAIFPGTLKANVKLSYCPFGGQKSSDIAIDCGNFIVYIEKKSEQALKNAIIDYREEPGAKGIGKLHIKAPYLKERHDLFSKIDFFLDTKINPSLKMHGGIVKLIEINEVNALVDYNT